MTLKRAPRPLSIARRTSPGVAAIRRAQNAFTLIELLLAIAMSATVMVTLYMALSIGLRGRDTVTASLEPVRAATLAVDLARADLESIVPPTGSRLAGPFIGTHGPGRNDASADSVQFYCLGGGTSWILPPSDSQAPVSTSTPGQTFAAQDPLDEGARMVELSLRTDVNPPVLVRRVTRDLLNTAPPQPEEEILCRNVRSFQVLYYDTLNTSVSSDPVSDWNSDDLDGQLPAAVQITLEIEYLKRGATEPSVYRVIRVIPIPCAKPPPTADSTGGAP